MDMEKATAMSEDIEKLINYKPRIICHKIPNCYKGNKKLSKYYEIKWYSIIDLEYHVGYGSYKKKYVKEWLHKEFSAISRCELHNYVTELMNNLTENTVSIRAYNELQEEVKRLKTEVNCNDD